MAPPSDIGIRSRVSRLVASIYGKRRSNSIMDGPWWLGVLLVVVVTIVILGSGPWRWTAILVAAPLFWLPALVRWSVAIWRSAAAFRDGFRS